MSDGAGEAVTAASEMAGDVTSILADGLDRLPGAFGVFGEILKTVTPDAVQGMALKLIQLMAPKE